MTLLSPNTHETGGLTEAEQRYRFVCARSRLMGTAPKPPKRVPVQEHVKPRRPLFTTPIEEIEDTAETPFNFLKPPGWGGIVKLVALKHGVSVEDMRGPSRVTKISHARQEAMALMHGHCGMSLPEVGRKFDRDHTTVLHAIRVLRKRKAAK